MLKLACFEFATCINVNLAFKRPLARALDSAVN